MFKLCRSERGLALQENTPGLLCAQGDLDFKYSLFFSFFLFGMCVVGEGVLGMGKNVLEMSKTP